MSVFVYSTHSGQAPTATGSISKREAEGLAKRTEAYHEEIRRRFGLCQGEEYSGCDLTARSPTDRGIVPVRRRLSLYFRDFRHDKAESVVADFAPGRFLGEWAPRVQFTLYWRKHHAHADSVAALR